MNEKEVIEYLRELKLSFIDFTAFNHGSTISQLPTGENFYPMEDIDKFIESRKVEVCHFITEQFIFTSLVKNIKVESNLLTFHGHIYANRIGCGNGEIMSKTILERNVLINLPLDTPSYTKDVLPV